MPSVVTECVIAITETDKAKEAMSPLIRAKLVFTTWGNDATVLQATSSFKHMYLRYGEKCPIAKLLAEYASIGELLQFRLLTLLTSYFSEHGILPGQSQGSITCPLHSTSPSVSLIRRSMPCFAFPGHEPCSQGI